MEGTKVVVCMVVLQLATAGMTILYKISIERGMSLRVLVAYRYIVGAALLCPLAFFLESATLNQNLYIASVKMGSATLAVAISNLLPAFTFILAVLFRLEKLQMRSRASQAKVIGTLIGMGGAALLTFYKGARLQLWSIHAHLVHRHAGSSEQGNLALGSLLATANTLCMAIWFIIQANPYTSTALVNLIAAVQCTCIAAVTERDASAWKLHWDGVVISGMVMLFTLWGIQKRGPLFVSVFGPLSLIIVALFGSVLLEEPLHLGSVLGAGFIILGLYTVLWGKGKEAKDLLQLQAQRSAGEAI
ncbi:WAT1-related protein [Nymphaea thermarum]|nr:WAT1-related protein [Nymphaea thermarum]